MNIASNPWSFTSADVASSTAAASPGGMVQAGAPAFGTVTYTTSGGAHGLSVGQHVTYIGDTNGRFLGHYVVVAIISTTVALLQNLSSPTSGSGFKTVLAASGGGTMLACQYPQMVRIEDISLQGTGGVPVGANLIMLDKNGSLIWTVDFSATPTESSSIAAQNRGKLFWVNGITLQEFPTNLVAIVTIN